MNKIRVQRSEDKEKDKVRLAIPEKKQKTRQRKATVEAKQKDKLRLATPEEKRKTRQRKATLDALSQWKAARARRVSVTKRAARAHTEKAYANSPEETVQRGGTWRQAT